MYDLAAKTPRETAAAAERIRFEEATPSTYCNIHTYLLFVLCVCVCVINFDDLVFSSRFFERRPRSDFQKRNCIPVARIRACIIPIFYYCCVWKHLTGSTPPAHVSLTRISFLTGRRSRIPARRISFIAGVQTIRSEQDGMGGFFFSLPDNSVGRSSSSLIQIARFTKSH